MFRHLKIVLFLFVFAFVNTNIEAQTERNNFSSVAIGLAYGSPISQNELNKVYRVGNTLTGRINTNYEIGFFSFQASFQENVPLSQVAPFNSWFLSVNYLAKIPLPKEFSLQIGPGLGSAYFRFYPQRARQKYYFESETFAKAELNLSKNLGSHFVLYFGLLASKVFTEPRLGQVTIEMGLAFQFANNKMVQKWMQ